MIEIVYDKKTAEEDVKKHTSYKKPKNIRQIGTASDKKKIYIEDYVMTFLRKIAEPGNTTSRGAILLGERFKEEDVETIFISGAIEAQNLEFDVEQIKFNDQIWSDLYSEINKYFENLSVVGWFLSRMGFSTDINEGINKIHHDNFKGYGGVLFVMDSLECEDAFYMWEKNHLVKQRGYYIYYVRNEDMQNYIISRKNTISEDKNNSTLRKDAELIKNFQDMRSDNKTKNKKGKSYFIYAAGSFFIVFALSMGIVISGSYDKMKDIESTVKKMEQENNKNEIQVFSNSNKNTEVEAEENNITAELADSESNVENNADNTEYVSEQEKTDEQNNTNEETQTEDNIISQTMATDSREYVIEEGDTLMSISIKMYDSPDYVDAIMETNNIKEGDTIYTGQKIYIPYIR